MTSRDTPVNRPQSSREKEKATDDRKQRREQSWTGSSRKDKQGTGASRQGREQSFSTVFEDYYVERGHPEQTPASPVQNGSSRNRPQKLKPKPPHERRTEMSEQGAKSRRSQESARNIDLSKLRVTGERGSIQKPKQSPETDNYAKPTNDNSKPGPSRTKKYQYLETPDGESHVIGYRASLESIRSDSSKISETHGTGKLKHLYYETQDGETHVIGHTSSYDSVHSGILKERDDQRNRDRRILKSDTSETVRTSPASTSMDIGRRIPTPQQTNPYQSRRSSPQITAVTGTRSFSGTSVSSNRSFSGTSMPTGTRSFSGTSVSSNRSFSGTSMPTGTRSFSGTSVSSNRSFSGTSMPSDQRIKYTNSKEWERSRGAKPKNQRKPSRTISRFNIHSKNRGERRVYFDPVEHSRRIRFQTHQDEAEGSAERNQRAGASFDADSTREIRFRHSAQANRKGPPRKDDKGSQSSSRTGGRPSRDTICTASSHQNFSLI